MTANTARKPNTKMMVDRREQRFTVVSSSELPILLQRHGTTAPGIQATAIDMSASGIKLSLNESLQFGEIVEIQITASSLDFQLTCRGEVRWMRNEDERWIIGCLFSESIGTEFLDKLALAGSIERRQSQRLADDIAAKVRLPGHGDELPITILDFSDKGLRFSSKKPMTIGNPIIVVLPRQSESVEVRATPRWRRRQDGLLQYGCEVSAAHCAKAFQNWAQYRSQLLEQNSRCKVQRTWLPTAVMRLFAWLTFQH